MSTALTKETNPKDTIAGNKVALALLSPIAKAHWALAQTAGMLKYGSWNWRVSGVRASVYLSAMQRHIDAYISGEETDPVDGSNHLGNIMACAAILLDAKAAKKLTDDRPPSVSLRDAYAFVEAQMPKLRELYKDKAPRHCTIEDTETDSKVRTDGETLRGTTRRDDEARPAEAASARRFREGDVVHHFQGMEGAFVRYVSETYGGDCVVDWGYRGKIPTLESKLTLLRRPLHVGDEIFVGGKKRTVFAVQNDTINLDGGGFIFFDTFLDVRHADGTPMEPVSANAPVCGAV